ncbi:histidine kinase [Salmonella enterica subsp. enterica serovar Livingstone]|nr:histidine kinase [Salmonella enterica subsp. enterica serovar Livingstone]
MAEFAVAARTLLHLGSELITSDEVAIYELIKNAFDSGSSRVSIKFFCPISSHIVSECNEMIDDSVDNLISLSDIKSLILNKLKNNWRILNENDEILDFDSSVELVRNSTDLSSLKGGLNKINYIEFEDSGSGMNSLSLKKAFLTIGTSYKKVFDTKDDGSPVLGNKGIGRLSMMRLGAIAHVETWTKNEENAHRIEFDWNAFDSSELLIGQINFPINEVVKNGKTESGTRISIYSLTSDWSEKRILNDIVNGFLRRLNNPFQTDLRRFPIDLYYNNSKRIPIKPIDTKLIELADRDLVLKFTPKKNAELSSEILKTVISIPGLENSSVPQSRTVRDLCSKYECSIKDLDSIGPFTLRIKWFNRSKLMQRKLGPELKSIRAELDLWNGGVAIYRDGFRVGLSGSTKDGDWLDIDNKALRGRGLTLNRIQTVGALEITKISNPLLIDRSNREGLIDSATIDLLRGIIQDFALSELRSHVQAEEKVQKKETENQLLDEGIDSIESRLKESEKIIHEIQTKSPECKTQIVSLHQNMQFITNSVKGFRDAINTLQEQREDILELAGVGNVMRSVMHELTRTTSQTRSLLSKIAKNADDETSDLLNKLEVEIKTLNTRLRQLDPLSTSGRNRKGQFELVGLIKTIINGYKARFLRHNIKFVLTFNSIPITNQTFLVKMVKGFVSLTIENIILNSVHWLKTGFIMPGDDSATIYINIDSDASVIEIYDNGPGISPSDRERIFSPGFSLRKDGHGYGLYIAKEVCANYDSDIYLDSEPFPDGRLRRFVIELPKRDD